LRGINQHPFGRAKRNGTGVPQGYKIFPITRIDECCSRTEITTGSLAATRRNDYRRDASGVREMETHARRAKWIDAMRVAH
jgi:hypothetical protein